MRIRLFFAAILISSYCTIASAVLPEQGLWWNPAESGRGYGIEIQDNFIFVTYYAYTSTGASAFYTSGGTYSTTTNTASVFFVALSNGQCFGCEYHGSPQTQNLGNATLTFFSTKTGRIDLPNGTSIPIQRQLFFDTQPRTNLYGTWHLTTGSLGVYFGQALWIQAPNNEHEGGFSGRVIDGSSQRILVGAPMDDGKVAILVDSSTSYYQFYVFEWSVNRWGGRSWTYLKSSQLSGSGLSFIGSRMLGKTYSEQVGSFNSNSEAQPTQAPDEATLDSVFSALHMIETSGTLQSKSTFSDELPPHDPEDLRGLAASLAESLSRMQSTGLN
ncbi:MAG: hypothetical protein WAR01_16025 [Dokdonella sp.]|nr:hypothetical protein [Xanthomonadales bacterium]